MRFHIRDSGDAAPCRARPGHCPLGSGKDHYATAEEARRAFEESQSQVHVKSLTNQGPTLAQLDARLEELRKMMDDTDRKIDEAERKVAKRVRIFGAK